MVIALAHRKFVAIATALPVVSAMFLGLAALGAAPSRAQDARAVRTSDIRVMTRNVYDGIDYFNNFGPGIPSTKSLEVSFNEIMATNPNARAALHARQIANENPDIIAIQEAIVAQKNGNPQWDMLSALITELRKLGKSYTIAAAMEGLDTGSGNPIRFTIWDAILVRSDLPPVTSKNSGPYQQSWNLVTGGLQDVPRSPSDYSPYNQRRNWGYIDIQVRGQAIRFATTHLDVVLPQTAQADELKDVIGNTTLPIVLTGDFNNSKESYRALDGFKDAWTTGGGVGSGNTCCQNSDLRNPTFSADQKIDLILLRGPLTATNAHLVGTIPATACSRNCTAVGPGTQGGVPTPIWASDHSGVVANIRITRTDSRMDSPHVIRIVPEIRTAPVKPAPSPPRERVILSPSQSREKIIAPRELNERVIR